MFDELNSKVKGVDSDKKEALDNAKYPVEGLRIEDGKVYYKDSLLENSGTARQIYVSTALVASTMNGIKAMRIDRAESMSGDDRKALVTSCNKLGIQVLMSRVSESGIVDGEITISEGVYNDG